MGSKLTPQIQSLAQRHASRCKVFGSPQRVLILWLLSEDECTVSEIAEALGSSLSSISQHLHLMELSNILESRREGQNIYYRVNEKGPIQSCSLLTNSPKGKLSEIQKFKTK